MYGLLENFYLGGPEGRRSREIKENAAKDESKKVKSESKLTGWISVKDRLPEVGTEVIVYSPESNEGKGKVTALARYIRYEGAINFYWDNDYPGSGNMYIQDAITHWMPLPEPPK